MKITYVLEYYSCTIYQVPNRYIFSIFMSVFFVEPIEEYKASSVRMESEKMAKEISAQIQDMYRFYGYELIVVPAMPLAERCDFVCEHIIGSR